jgi:hypothetical protein
MLSFSGLTDQTSREANHTLPRTHRDELVLFVTESILQRFELSHSSALRCLFRR